MAKTNGNSVPWAGLFFGRQQELQALESAYRRVRDGYGPEVCVILGESGLGKTRIAQEFFAHLSTSDDVAGGEGYWPDRMVRDGNNLKINPDPTDCNESGIGNMRFLWWGIRLTDPISRNAGANSFTDATAILRSHLEPFAKAKMLSARLRGAAQAAALDVAVELGNLFTFGLVGLGKLGLDHGREWKSIWDDHRNARGAGAGSEHARETQGMIDMVLRDFETLFERSGKKGDALPAVLLLDDAQWIENGDIAHQFAAQLLARAREHNWPILLLATHWEKEWHEHLANKSGFAGLLDGTTPEGWQPITLRKEPDLAGMITAGFPGLSRKQVALLIEKADGNPRLLDEILRHLLTSRGHFEKRDLGNPLTAKGEETLREQAFDLHSLVAERLSQAPDEVQVAVALSGYQGIQFLSRITAAAAAQIGGADYADGLGAAERPYSLVATLEHGLAEFSQRVFYEVARERLPHVVGEEEAVEAIRSVLRDLAGELAQFETLGEEERKAALQLGARVMWDPETGEIESDDWELALWCKARLADTSILMYGDEEMRREVTEAWGNHMFGVAMDHEGTQLINRVLAKEHGWEFAKDLMAREIANARRDFEREPSVENRRWLNDALHDAVYSEYWDQQFSGIGSFDSETLLPASEPDPSDIYRPRIEEGLELSRGCETPHLTTYHYRWLHLLRDELGEDEGPLKLDIQQRILDLAEANGSFAAVTGDWGRRLMLARYELGKMYSYAERYEESIEPLERALFDAREINRIDGEISPSIERDTLYHLAWNLREIGRVDEGKTYSDQYEKFARGLCSMICSELPPEDSHTRGCRLPSDLIEIARMHFDDGNAELSRAVLEEVLAEITDDNGEPLAIQSRYRKGELRFPYEDDMVRRCFAEFDKNDPGSTDNGD